MPRQIKCQYCNKKFDKIEGNYEKVNTKYYHKECFAKWQQENQDRQELYDCIKEIFHITFPTGFMLRQIKEYKEVRGYTYKGMTLALKYFFEIQKNNPKVQSLGIIPYIYDQAKKYWRDIKIKQKQMEKDEQPKEKIIINIFSEENKPIELNDIANL
jgi:hypothetical protein